MEVLQMTQIINIFMLAGEEISGLSSSTQILLLVVSIIAFVSSILMTYESYKDLRRIFKENKEKEKRWERVLQQAENELQGIPTTSTEGYQQQKIRFK
jgi:ABC-type multidrug transport system fused ATPase/permease subunit